MNKGVIGNNLITPEEFIQNPKTEFGSTLIGFENFIHFSKKENDFVM